MQTAPLVAVSTVGLTVFEPGASLGANSAAEDGSHFVLLGGARIDVGAFERRGVNVRRRACLERIFRSLKRSGV